MAGSRPEERSAAVGISADRVGVRLPHDERPPKGGASRATSWAQPQHPESREARLLPSKIFIRAKPYKVIMAKHGKRGNMGNYLKGAVDEELAIATLGANDVVGANFDSVMVERGVVTSLVAAYSIRGLSSASDDGPIMVGVAHSDYDDAEIEEYIENLGSWDPGDKISQERARRQIRKIGVFESRAEATEAVTLNDGKPIKTKLNWQLSTGDTLKLWAYNMGASPLATTVPDINCQGHCNIFLK